MPDVVKEPTMETQAEQGAETREAKALYRPELDMLRFFAFLSVMLVHGVLINPESSMARRFPSLVVVIDFVHRIGKDGLPLFFFLSSFLITTLLIAEKRKTGKVHLPSFYVRRVLRIWPLYFGFMTAAYFAGHIWHSLYFTPHLLLAFFLVAGNWYILASGMPPESISFLWSISVEEQFYLLWPTLVRNLSAKGIAVVSTAMLAMGFACIGAIAAGKSTIFHIWINSGTQMIFFAGGALLALRLDLREQRKNGWLALGSIAAGLLCWLMGEWVAKIVTIAATTTVARAVPMYALVCAGCAAVLYGFLHLPRICIRPSLVYLGRISYGLYVFQGIALLIGARYLQPHLHGGLWIFGSLALCVLLAVPSYEFYEKPFLRLKRRFEFIHSRPVANTGLRAAAGKEAAVGSTRLLAVPGRYAAAATEPPVRERTPGAADERQRPL